LKTWSCLTCTVVCPVKPVHIVLMIRWPLQLL